MTDHQSPDSKPKKQGPTVANQPNGQPDRRRRRLEPVVPPEPTAYYDYESYGRRPGVRWRLIIWSVLLTLAGLLLVAYGQAFFGGPPAQPPAGDAGQPAAIRLTPTATPTPSATPTSRQATFSFLEPTVTPTPLPGGRILLLSSQAAQAGWVVSNDPDPFRRNYLGDTFLYAGALEGQRYHAILKFDLSDIPRGSKIHAASLRLTGLRSDQLGETGQWQLQLMPSVLDYQWANVDYRQVTQTTPLSSFPPLGPEQLGPNRVNQFDFDPAQRQLLEQRLLQGNAPRHRSVTFRLDGPTEGDNLFAWDSGRGQASQGNGPQLFLSLGPAPDQTPPPYYTMVTSTPTTESVLTAQAISLEMTAQATRRGTATPLPPFWATPYVVTPTPTAENEATAQMMQIVATAIALTTSQPPNLATATASPTYVIITSTPTPEEIATAAAQALAITSQARRDGTATPRPDNWVTPMVVTSTPEPENEVTVTYLRAIALTTGTPTPLPANAQTATPTPVSVLAELIASPTTTATPSPTPQNIPASLLGKILFLSDREGAGEEERIRAAERQATPQVTPQPFVFDPASGQLERLTARWPLEVAATREAWSADLQVEAYNKALLWTNVEVELANGSIVRRPTTELAIHVYDHVYNVEQQVTRMGAGIVYDPAWSPVSDELAFVATESGNDEIWTIHRDGTDARQLTRNDWPWDKHPSWSPDGQQIVFYSNRTGTNQLWIMNKDGSDQRLLMPPNPYNDIDPVWVKYLEPAPGLERLPDWRFVKPAGEPAN